MGKFSRSWAIARASVSVLWAHWRLLVFPLLSFACCAALCAIFFLPSLEHFRAGGPIRLTADPRSLAGLFLLNAVLQFVGLFFNTALVGAALIGLDGGKPTLAAGLRIAFDRIGAVLGYALLCATVGVALRYLEERTPFLGRIVSGLFGATWTVATFLVVPVLAAQNVGPFSAIRQSGAMLRRSWGENLIGNVGISVGLNTLAGFPVVICVIGGLTLWAKAPILALGLFFTGGGVLIASILISSALDAIFAAALYRFTADGRLPKGFDADLIGDSFRSR